MSIRDFGSRIAARRIELGFKSHGALADKAKLNRSVIYNIENSKVQDIEVETFLKISKALSWTPEEAVSAYLGKSIADEKERKERLYQTTIDYLNSLSEAKIIELK